MKKNEAVKYRNMIQTLASHFGYLYKYRMKNTRKKEIARKIASHLLDASDYIDELIRNLKEDDEI